MSRYAAQRVSSDPRLPPEAYASHIEALFGDRISLMIGAAAAGGMATVTAAETHRTSLLCVALALFAVGAARLWLMARFATRQRPLDATALRRWERSYVAGGVAHVGLLGLFCVVAFAGHDAFARLASVAGLMAYLVGIPGRSFASVRLVDAQILAAAVPLLLAFLIPGREYLWIWFLILLPFLVALRRMSGRLNGIFVAALTRAHDLDRLAGRFDTALNNMPHGLAMFSDDGTVVVTNHRLADLMGISPEVLAGHVSLERLWATCTEGASNRTSTPEALRAEFETNANSAKEWVLPMADGRVIAFRRQLIASGGGVLTAEDVTERVRAVDEVAYLARHDALTGLCNRRSFAERADALRVGAPRPVTALLFVDLDQFKSINDTLGHAVGDRLLVEVARRLRATAGSASVLARLGGDEFVIFGAFGDVDGPASMASAIIAELSEAYEIDEHRILVGASVGIAPTRGDASVDALLIEADLALYTAKSEGRGSFRFFETTMQEKAQARREIEDDLRRALPRGELEVHYQPIHSLRENAFVVCEALVRWRHPRRGLVPPSEFIPVAEEIGLVGEIGDWVLNEACGECAAWPSDVGVAVNVSAVQFRRDDVPARVAEALRTSGLAPSRLEIEITESALLHDMEAVGGMLRRLREHGVGVSLDDFGTGYSSLSYLHALPFSKVKIDRSFLGGAQPGNRTLTMLSGVARLAVALGMTVVVEGVETSEQLHLVASQGCIEQVQGFFFSRPLTPDQLRATLLPGRPAKVA